MYLSAERLAVAEREVTDTFEQTSIAWQAIPYWDTGDPGQSRVRNDVVNAPGFLNIELQKELWRATLAQLGAPTPDSLLAEVMATTASLAAKVDWKVIDTLRNGTGVQSQTFVAPVKPEDIMNGLIEARAKVEDAGYRAPSCLITNTEGLKLLSAFSGGIPVTDVILTAANINSLHRTTWIDKSPPDNDVDAPKPIKSYADKVIMILLGRRQRIAPGCAADVSPGEEPVDLAVSVAPSLELVGEDLDGKIGMATRIRYALRITDPNGVVLLKKP
jgi:hypothetical protein